MLEIYENRTPYLLPTVLVLVIVKKLKETRQKWVPNNFF